MRASFLNVAIGLSVCGTSYAVPTEPQYLYNILSKRAISPNNTCGNSFNGENNGYSCDAMVNAGGCCSVYGFCGNTTDYCGTGCQTEFGTCNPEAVVNTFQCGPANGNLACTGGLCCSGAGYCGNTTDYCAASNGCQPSYGQCNGTMTGGGDGGVCGPNNGNAVCIGDQCCSVSGYCGTTEDFCSDPNNCAPEFGRCDSDTTPAGPSTINAPRPELGSISYTDDIIDCVVDDVVALTYDDGPYLYTAQLLDILKSYGFTATFFITGNNNGKGAIDTTQPYPALIQRMIAEGHQVASHTWSHYSLNNITHDARIQQMVKNEMAFNNIIGMWPTYMRPPYSECSASTGCEADIESLGYHRLYFDLDTQDYLNPSPTQIQNSKDIVRAALQSPGITDYLAIQHDIVEQSVTNLSSYFYDQIMAKGFKGVTVGECLGDDKSNWYRSLSGVVSSVPPAAGTSGTSFTKPTISSVTFSNSATSPTASLVISSTSATNPTASPITSRTSVAYPTTPSVTTSTAPIPTKVSTSTLTSNSAVSTTSKTVTSTSSKVAAPTSSSAPAPSCLKIIGNFCGNVTPFTTQAGCYSAVADCNKDVAKCAAQGLNYILQCFSFTNTCVELSTYCLTCKNSCSNAKFGSGSTGSGLFDFTF